MAKILVGGVSPEGERLIRMYLDAFVSNYTIEPIKAIGIKGKIKNTAPKADVLLVIIDTSLWHQASDVAMDVLKLPKVHKYTDDEHLEQFLISKFGRLSGTVSGVVQESSQDESFSVVDGATEELNKKVSELQSKLSSSEMMVRNLTMQLREKRSGDDDDVSELIARIRELESELANRVTDEQSEAQAARLRAEAKQANDDKALISFERDNLVKKVSVLEEEIEHLKQEKSEVDSLSASVKEKDAEIESLHSQLAQKTDEASNAQREVGRLTSEMEVMQTELTSGKEEYVKFAEVKKELADKRLALENLTVDIESIRGTLISSQAEAERLRDELQTKSYEISKLHDELSKKALELDEKEKSLRALESSGNDKVAELNKQVRRLEQQVEQLTEDLDAKTSEVNGQAENLFTEVSRKDQEISRLMENLRGRDSELGDVRAELDLQKTAVDRLLVEKDELESKLVSTEESRLDLGSQVKKLTADIDELRCEKAMHDEQVSALSADKAKLSNQISSLEAELVNSKADEETIHRLEGELLDERRASARLKSEVAVLRKTSDSGKTSELRIEIARLKKELEEAGSSSRVDELNAELLEVRQRCAGLEVDLASKNEELEEISEGVWVQMGGVAIPKATFPIKAQYIGEVSSKFICIASGSASSVQSMYALASRTCGSLADKRILFLDLESKSSYVDSEFGVKTIVSPINWLCGETSFKEFIANTRYSNVKVISTGLAYLNDLYMLTVDWKRRLSELEGFSADIVMVNVGCLDCVVTKVLFNTFCEIMRSFVVIKATPISLRTGILNLTGLLTEPKKLNNVMSVCVDFNEKTSKAMYQRLATKYKARIFGDRDVLNIV